MGKYIIKRLGLAALTLVIISAITFFAMNAIPGGPFTSEKTLSASVEAALRARYNLDLPVWQQYLIYMKNLLQGDWGVSLNDGRDIWPTISARFAISAQIGLRASVIAIITGIVLGCTAALNRNKWPDRLIIFATTFFTAMPSFVFATLLLLIFCTTLGWFQVWSATSTNYTLPVIALSAYPMAYITRLTKTAMLDALGQDYVRTARAKGVAQVFVVFKHALRNALIPVVTYIGPMIAGILTGSMVVESIFTIGGLGSEFASSITNRDYTMIMGTTMFLAILMVAANLITDIVYKFIDPRIKLG